MKQFLLTVSLSIFLISFSVIFTLNFRPLYYADIKLLHISRESRSEKTMTGSLTIIQYFIKKT